MRELGAFEGEERAGWLAGWGGTRLDLSFQEIERAAEEYDDVLPARDPVRHAPIPCSETV